MYRSYAGFLRSRPAIGLLLMRAAMALAIGSRPGFHFVEASAALLVLGGAWTRGASTLIALVEVWRAIALSGPWVSALLATMAVTLVLTGPGSWSVDAQFFGWRRIDIPATRRSGGSARTS